MLEDVYLGELQCFPFDVVPEGWMKCDGQLLPIHSNLNLYSVIGNSFGGDRRKHTFALPDLRGRAPMGQGDGFHLVSRTFAEQVGSETVALTKSEMPFHQHMGCVVASSHAPNSNTPQGNWLGTSTIYLNGTPGEPCGAVETEDVGEGKAHENMQPSLVTNWCIAVQGRMPDFS